VGWGPVKGLRGAFLTEGKAKGTLGKAKGTLVGKAKGTLVNGIRFSQGTRPKWVANNMDGTY